MPEVKTYTITNVEARDVWGPVHGSMMQDYAIALGGEKGWIKLTQKPETRPPRVDDELQGYIMDGTNSNGTPYRKFKKENPEYAGANRSDTTPSVSSSKSLEQKLDYAVQMLEELTDRRDAVDQPAQAPKDELGDPFEGFNI